MLCYKNGALAREAIRDEFANKSWDEYNSLVASTPPGNEGKIGLYYPLKEIIPPNVQGRFFFDVSRGEVIPIVDVGGIKPSFHPRAILESQLLSIKARLLDIIPTEHTGTLKLSKVLVTGGSAQNHIIQQVCLLPSSQILARND
jgi:xylulokinase